MILHHKDKQSSDLEEMSAEQHVLHLKSSVYK